jgi:hypothetical protein
MPSCRQILWGRELRDLTVSRDRCAAVISLIRPDRMLASLADELTAVPQQVLEELALLHEVSP